MPVPERVLEPGMVPELEPGLELGLELARVRVPERVPVPALEQEPVEHSRLGVRQ